MGSVLKLLTHTMMEDTVIKNCEKIWEIIKQYYQKSGITTRLHDLRPGMFQATRTTFPCLKAKGAEIKHLASPLKHVWLLYMDTGNEQHGVIKRLFLLIEKIEGILDNHKHEFRLPDGVAQEFEKCMIGFAQLSTTLSNYFHGEGALGYVLFNWTIKFHYAVHLGMIGQYCNPNLGLCYMGEDLMQHVRTLIQGNVRGSAPPVVVAKVMRKYSRALSMLLDKGCWQW